MGKEFPTIRREKVVWISWELWSYLADEGQTMDYISTEASTFIEEERNHSRVVVDLKVTFVDGLPETAEKVDSLEVYKHPRHTTLYPLRWNAQTNGMCALFMEATCIEPTYSLDAYPTQSDQIEKFRNQPKLKPKDK